MVKGYTDPISVFEYMNREPTEREHRVALDAIAAAEEFIDGHSGRNWVDKTTDTETFYTPIYGNTITLRTVPVVSIDSVEASYAFGNDWSGPVMYEIRDQARGVIGFPNNANYYYALRVTYTANQVKSPLIKMAANMIVAHMLTHTIADIPAGISNVVSGDVQISFNAAIAEYGVPPEAIAYIDKASGFVARRFFIV